jgi:uroporphyrinogen-III decarboxylase
MATSDPPAARPITFSPGIYEHAAALIGEPPALVSRDANLLFRAQRAAWQTYRHPMVVAGIDVYGVEPEAMGAGLGAAVDHGVPCVISHPLSSASEMQEVVAPDPACAARMPIVLDAARRLIPECPGASVFVPVCGPLALANGLMGMDELLCAMIEEPARVRQALVHLAGLQERYVRAILRAGARPLIFESGASPPLLPPALFREVEAPALGRLFDVCRQEGEPAPSCILGGDAEPIARDLLALRPGFLICPSETDQARFVEIAASHPDTAIRVNMPVAALLGNDWARAVEAADAALALARRHPRGSVGTGVVPYDASPALLVKLRDYVELDTPS